MTAPSDPRHVAPTGGGSWTCECCERHGQEMWAVWSGSFGDKTKFYVCKDVAACNARRPALSPTP